MNDQWHGGIFALNHSIHVVDDNDNFSRAVSKKNGAPNVVFYDFLKPFDGKRAAKDQKIKQLGPPGFSSENIFGECLE